MSTPMLQKKSSCSDIAVLAHITHLCALSEDEILNHVYVTFVIPW